MTTRYNVLICPFNLWGRTIRNPLTIIRENMLVGIAITYHSNTIGHVMGNNVRVGSDGFYADIGVVDYYANTKFEFKDLSWNGFPCDGNKWVVESISQIVMKLRT